LSADGKFYNSTIFLSAKAFSLKRMTEKATKYIKSAINVTLI